MYGYIGKMLFIDLTDQSVEVRDLPEDLARQYLGGPGLGARILYDEMPAHTPWDAPESILGFLRGPLCGNQAFFGGRWTVVSKSPVYDGWNDANCGGFFGPEMTKAGYDAIFFRGISEKPVYVFIDNDKVTFHDASHLWGKTTTIAEDAIKEELGDKNIQVAQIAPAGENLSYMAAVMTDYHRAAGRGGSGAIMGSKKLKAVAVRGSQHVDVADIKTLHEYSHKTIQVMRGPKKEFMENGKGRYGTAGGAVPMLMINSGSIRNWSGSVVDDFPEDKVNLFNAHDMDEGRRTRKYACAACPLGCGAYYEAHDDRLPEMGHTGRPEYETITGFGSMMLCEDVNAMLACNHLCNEYGFDTIAMAGTVAWAMEVYSDGKLPAEMLDGIDLVWGNADAMLEVTKRICENKGNCAKLLLNGSEYAAKMIDDGYYALFCASGIELAQHDPRVSFGLGRTYQYDPTPGRHVKGGIGLPVEMSPDAELRHNTYMTGFDDVTMTAMKEIENSSGFCMSYKNLMDPYWMYPIVNGVTGFNYSRAEFRLLGMRMFIMRLAFNVREGMRRKDYTISPRCISEPRIKHGPLAGVVVDIEKLADNFMDALGCTPDFVPKKELLEILEMEFLIPDFYPEEAK